LCCAATLHETEVELSHSIKKHENLPDEPIVGITHKNGFVKTLQSFSKDFVKSSQSRTVVLYPFDLSRSLAQHHECLFAGIACLPVALGGVYLPRPT
jgi:hypothetical protein